MANFINKKVGEYFSKKFKPKNWKPLLSINEIIFKIHGEGIYYANIKSKQNNFMAKAISFFSGGLTHTVAIIYSKDLKSWFTPGEWKKIEMSWNNYYNNTKKLDSSIKVLVLASADSNGMNFLDWSNYQARDYSLRKPDMNKDLQLNVVQWLAKIKPLLYDYTGLIFWILYKTFIFFKFLDDPESYFCSENIYDAFKEGAGYEIANMDNPSPKDIEDYKKNIIVYKTNNF